jgi:hypothetical protein
MKEKEKKTACTFSFWAVMKICVSFICKLQCGEVVQVRKSVGIIVDF